MADPKAIEILEKFANLHLGVKITAWLTVSQEASFRERRRYIP